MTAQERCLLHVSLIEGVGDATIGQIVRQSAADGWSLESLYTLSARTLANYCHLSLERAELIVQGLCCTRLLDQELSLLERHSVGFMTILDENYPHYLKAIHAPPAVVYWQGNSLSADEYCIAVIGSRRVNYYGLSAIEKLVPPLVEAGWSIVSGGAIGADSKAHAVTLDAGGRTIAILGSGLLKPYPTSNKKLFEKMLVTGGTLVSPFPLMMEGLPGNFPARNRIIAGLSYGCLVAQAAAKSGTHITAQYALEEGRELFAVPGAIDDPLSAGCHRLIQQGAKLVHEPQDMLSELPTLATGAPSYAAKEDAPAPSIVTGPEDAIVAACGTPCSIDELAVRTNMSVQELYAMLFMLEVNGNICRQSNGMWVSRAR